MDPSPSHLQALVDRLNRGDLSARDELIGQACERLRRLTRRLMQDFRRVRAFEESDDVVQNAAVRLMRRLRARPPASVAEFFRQAAREIRCELIDLARSHYGPHGMGANLARPAPRGGGETPPAPADPADTTNDPARLASWTELHQRVEALPEEEQAVFDLLWYQGLSQEEAAGVLGVSLATVKRRWLSARLRLQELLEGRPGEGHPE